MAFYKHYSFDLWLTLIKSNPQFKVARTAYFFKHFNAAHKSIEEVGQIFRQVDLMINAINEKTGKNVDADEMYLMVIALINNFNNNFKLIALDDLHRDMEKLLFTYPPVLYSNETLNVLAQIKAKPSVTTNILSNTGFIKGKTLRNILNHLGIAEYIDFQLYSDEVRMSKPNQNFFKLMLKEANQYQKLNAADVIHVGDNQNADILGAHAVGINSLLVNSNHQTISHLLL